MEKKKCKKGVGKASGHVGCGKEIAKIKYGKSNFKYGLGISCKCFSKWVLNTKEGKEYLKSVQILSSKKVREKLVKERKKSDAKARIKNMSTDKYRSKYVQPRINKIARLIDYGQTCIATGNYGKMSGGHYIAVGANRTTSLNLHNIFTQSFQSNSYKGGDVIKYREGIIKTFGKEYMAFIDSLRSHPVIKLTKDDLVEIKNKADILIKKYEFKKIKRTSKERIQERNKVNKRLGIYLHDYSYFEIK